jgi:hypothetical protein
MVDEEDYIEIEVFTDDKPYSGLVGLGVEYED